MKKKLNFKRSANIRLENRRKYEHNSNKSDLTKDKKKIILEAIRAGMKPYRAADLAGISPEIFRRWLDKGIKGSAKYKPKYGVLREQVLTLEKQRELESLEVIRNAAQPGQVLTEVTIEEDDKGKKSTKTKTREIEGKWAAAAWYLERLEPDVYGLKAKHDEMSVEERAKHLLEMIQAMKRTVPAKNN